MRRNPSITVTIALLMACTVDKPVPEASAGDDGGAGSSGSEGGDDPGQSQTAAGLSGVEGGDATTGGGSTGDTCSYICEATESGPIEDGQCDPWTQDCPEEQKCAAWANDGSNAWNSTHCVPIQPNPVAAGEPCTAEGGGLSGIDTCQEGAMCWDIDPETGTGVCVALCTGSPDAPSCADPNASCTVSNEGVLNLCLAKCDPLLQDCQDPGDACLPNPVNPEHFICVFDASGETGKAFDVCEYGNACDPGLLCATPELATECDAQAVGCCLPFCDTTAPSCPGAGQECLAWYEANTAPPGYENIGLCGLPMG